MTAPIEPGSRVFLVDGSGYIFRAYHALPRLTRASDGLPIGAVAGFCNMLWKMLREFENGEKPTHFAVIFDASEKTFRNEMYSEYKAHRPPAPEDLVPQFSLIRDATRAFGAPAIDMIGYEADDLIATYARQAARAGATVTIVSSDKDLMQLIEDGRIFLYDPMKQKPLGPDAVMEKFGVAPDKVIDVQALIGDSVDNVPGAPGIGPKTAAELIGQFGDLDTVLARAGEIKQQKRRETLINFADQIRMSRDLVTLKDDVPVEETLESFAARDITQDHLIEFLEAMEFKTLTRRVREQLGLGGVTPAPAAANGGASAKPNATPMQAPSTLAAAAIDERQLAPVNVDAYETILTMEQLNAWISRAREAGVLAVDTETDALSSSHANLVGISLGLGPNDACYIPLTHKSAAPTGAVANGDLFGEAAAEPLAVDPAAPAQLPLGDAITALKPVLEDPSVLKIGQNIKYDLAVLRRYGIDVAPYDDSMLISYALEAGAHQHGMDELSELHLNHTPISFTDVCGSGKKQISFDQVALDSATRYSGEDCDVTLRLWSLLKPRLVREGALNVYETIERPLPAIVADMELAGIKVDRDVLNRLSGEFAQRMGALEAEAHELAGKPFNPGSPKQIGDILFGEMSLPGGKKTASGAWATDVSVLEDLAAQGHALPRTILDWRQLSKLKSTYADALRDAADPRTGRVHTSYSLAATQTGRLASTDPNLQNIPIRTEEGRKIREAFVAEPGHVLISADYSQIELRLLAHVANIESLKKAFRDGLDIHAMTASEMFDVPIEGMDPMIRRRAKAINFGIIYGISAFGLARQLSIQNSEAAAYIARYFERFPGIRDYMNQAKEFARENGFVTTIFGRKLHIKDVKSTNQAQRGFAERQAINAPLQGSAADLIKRAMIRLPDAIAEKGLKARMLLQVHDELIFEAPQEEADAVCALAADVMARAHLPAAELSIPLVVEARAATNWSQAH